MIMFDKLLGVLQFSKAIALMVLINSVGVNAQEYVFSAPSEVNDESVEIPSSDQEYPLYECESSEQSSSEKIDSHNCDCVDCEANQDSAKEDELASQNRQDK